jgi:Flp pilus assembly pilin Flp
VFSVLHHEEGQGLVEYGLILSLIVIFAIAGLIFIRGGINGMLSLVGSGL